MKRVLLIVIIMWVGSVSATAKTLSVPQLVQNIQRAHPYIAAMEEKGLQRRLALTQQESVFDPTIEQTTSARVSGYYDGAFAEQRYIQPLQTMNARLYSEYRLADGDFPVYEEAYRTLSGGEASLGVALSLLRDREIDKRRLGVSNARLAITQWQSEFAGSVNETLYKGVSHYLYWFETALQLHSVAELLEATESRQLAYEVRVEQGDLAESDLVEFQANMLQQRLLLSNLKQKLLATQLDLGFYLRNERGEMVLVDDLAASSRDIAWPYAVTQTKVMALRKKLASHPALVQIQQDIRMLQNKQMLADNALLPKLDIKASLGRDIGSGPASLEGTESKLGLQFSFPLGNRAARAEVASLGSKYNELSYKRQLISDRIRQAFDKAYRNWQQAREIATLQRDNADLAMRLYDMERQRYEMGDSDMFVLNARESARIKAHMSRIKADVDVYMAELALHHAAASLTL